MEKAWYTKWWIILFIVIGVILFLFGSTIYEHVFEKQYTRNNFKQLVTAGLEEEGYEVIFVISGGESGHTSVRMKSLGDTQDQVEDAIFQLGYYSNVAGYKPSAYSVTILEPTQTCFYTTLMYGGADEINAYMDELTNYEIDVDDLSLEKSLAYHKAIENMIARNSCS